MIAVHEKDRHCPSPLNAISVLAKQDVRHSVTVVVAVADHHPAPSVHLHGTAIGVPVGSLFTLHEKRRFSGSHARDLEIPPVTRLDDHVGYTIRIEVSRLTVNARRRGFDSSIRCEKNRLGGRRRLSVGSRCIECHHAHADGLIRFGADGFPVTAKHGAVET